MNITGLKLISLLYSVKAAGIQASQGKKIHKIILKKSLSIDFFSECPELEVFIPNPWKTPLKAYFNLLSIT